MRDRWARAGIIVLGLGLLLLGRPAAAVVTRLTPLQAVLTGQKLIFMAKVEAVDPQKPSLVLNVTEPLKGKPRFTRMPVNLTGDREGQKEKHPALLLKRVATGLTLIVFANPEAGGKRYNAFGYTNGTWFQVIGHVDKDNPAVIHWAFTHCEPYLRRTYKGTTDELRQVIRDGLDGKKQPPEPDPKEPPGLGPELPKSDKESNKQGDKQTAAAPVTLSPCQLVTLSRPGPLLAVIPTFALVGPLALLAALFPAVFGGLMLVLRRWTVLLAVASLDSTIFFLHNWFQGSIQGFWWGTPLGLWSVLTAVTLAGAVWSWRRYRGSPSAAREAALEPRRSEQVILGGVSLVGLVVVLVCLWRGALGRPPWKELLVLWAVTWVGALYVTYLRLGAARRRAFLPAEEVMLWALVFACAGFGATLLPRSEGTGGVAVAWVFRPVLQPGEQASVFSSPLVAGDRVYFAAAHSRGLTTFGRVYCVDRATGRLIWTFDNDEEMKQVSISSPCLAEGLLYVGEGFHQDTDCKLYCLEAGTGKKRWEHQTGSHVESSPCVADGRVFFGAGDDGVVCYDARTGAEAWHFGGIHVDTSPAVVNGRLYAGTGYGQNYQVFCLDAACGRPLWRRTVDLPVWGSPYVVGDRVLLGLGTGDFLHDGDPPQGALLCLDAGTGEVRVDYRVPGAVLMKPAVDAATQRVYFASRDRHAYCLDLREGKLIWKRDLGSPVVADTALAGARLYVAATGGQVACLRADTGDLVWSFDVAGHAQAGAELFSSPAVQGGRIYFGAGLRNAVGGTAALYFLEEQQ